MTHFRTSGIPTARFLCATPVAHGQCQQPKAPPPAAPRRREHQAPPRRQHGRGRCADHALRGALQAALLRRMTRCAAPSPASQPATQQRYPKVPEVGGDAAGWRRAGSVVAARVTGSNAASIHMSGASPWSNADGKLNERIGAWWVMQQDTRLRYDADRGKFFTTDSSGARRDVADISEIKKVINDNGGAAPSNATAYRAVGAFIAGKLG